ncbi:hypothetical protein [Paenibacillus alginolyticus]|uniref:hypothetical protein n=1 Tax=Paenibacillus alginolyticus TaxID=59839 RepID=UPI0015670799|nr:hypothetical protein [Paenibacillus frigoriresistens]
MKIRFGLIYIILIGCFLSFEQGAFAHPNPRLEVIEDALLQQLKPVIMSSLKEIFKEEYSQFNCEKILSINEGVTLNKNKEKARPVDAIHGAQYFEIKIALCRPDGHTVEMNLRNDTANAQYYLVEYKIK